MNENSGMFIARYRKLFFAEGAGGHFSAQRYGSVVNLPSGMVLHFRDTRLPGTVCTTVEGLTGLDAMPDNFATTVVTDRSEFLNSALEAIKRMSRVRCNDFKGPVVVVAAYIALRHLKTLPNSGYVLVVVATT